MINAKTRLLALLVTLAAPALGCAGGADRMGDGSPEGPGAEVTVEDRPRLWLSVSDAAGGDDAEVLVHFVRGRETQGPRVLELRLSVSGPVALESAVAGPALARADKDLVAQQREPGVVRLVAYSSAHTAEVESGVLARLRLKRTGQGEAHVDVLTDRPLFAPAAAQQGLLIGDPIRI